MCLNYYDLVILAVFIAMIAVMFYVYGNIKEKQSHKIIGTFLLLLACFLAGVNLFIW